MVSRFELSQDGQSDPQGVDKETVAYYKKFFSQVDGGSEFATELVKEHEKAELEQEHVAESHQLKLGPSSPDH